MPKMIWLYFDVHSAEREVR